MKKHCLIITASLVTACLQPLCVSAQTKWYVALDGLDDGTNDGLSWQQPLRTVTNALASADAGDTILISDEVHLLEETFSVTKAVTICGTGVDANGQPLATLDAQGLVRCVELNKSGALLDTLTITRGSAKDDGAGITTGGGLYIDAGTVSNCWITGCEASGSGGGIYVNTEATITDCVISNNVANLGGGIAFAAVSGNPRQVLNSTVCNNLATSDNSSVGGGGMSLNGIYLVSNSTVRANTASCGGGIQLRSSSSYKPQLITDSYIIANIATNRTLNLELSRGLGGGISQLSDGSTNALVYNCLIAGNTAFANQHIHGGGGVATDAGRFYNCTIVSNTACSPGDGGGVFTARSYRKSRVMFVNCLIAENKALGNHYGGGGIYHYRGSLDLLNCTIVANWSDKNCGGVGRLGSAAASSGGHDYYHTVCNNIIYHNDSGSGTKNVTLGEGHKPAFTNNCIGSSIDFNQYGSGNFDVDPGLVDVEEGNYRLKADSACLNAGFNLSWMAETLDLDKNPRIDKLSDVVDIGCYERMLRGTYLLLR